MGPRGAVVYDGSALESDRPALKIDSDRAARAARMATSAAAAFSAFTFAWIAVGLANTGDAFPQGLAKILLPLPLVAPFLGAFLGWRLRSRWVRVTLGILAVLALAFWALVRDGWWASELPPLTPVRDEVRGHDG